MSSSSKSYIKASKNITEKALGSPDIRGKILSYSLDLNDSCKIATKNANNCSINRIYRNRNNKILPCAYYCMANCDKWELSKLLDYPTKITIVTYKGIRYESLINAVFATFYVTELGIDLRLQHFVDPEEGITDINVMDDQKDNNIIHLDDPVDSICKFIKDYIGKYEIRFKAEIDFDNESLLHIDKSMIAGMEFDKPYIRPENQWEYNIGNSQSIFVEFTLQKN